MPDASRLVISNTTPIIALALIGHLDLMHTLYGEVWIPPAVAAEVEAGGTRVGAAELLAAPYLRTMPLDDPRRADLLNDLDRGEAEVLALAQERNADLVVLDERLGRRHARRLGLPLTGTLGVLLRAKRDGHIPAVRPLVQQLQRGGIHLNARLITRILELAGETQNE